MNNVFTEWRQRAITRTLDVWEPRVGKEAATTYASGRIHTVQGVVGYILAVVLTIVLELLDVPTLFVVVISAITWFPTFFSVIQGYRLQQRAHYQASKLVAIKEMAVPMTTPELFDRWVKESANARPQKPIDGLLEG